MLGKNDRWKNKGRQKVILKVAAAKKPDGGKSGCLWPALEARPGSVSFQVSRQLLKDR